MMNSDMQSAELRDIWERVRAGTPRQWEEWAVAGLFGAVVFALAFVWGGYYT